MTSLERFRAAQRIQAKWRSIATLLEMKAFRHNEIHDDSERALEMLEAWANKFGDKATRRRFITALKDAGVGYSNEIAEIFSF